MCVHDPPQVSLLWGSAAQTIDGNLRVRVPGFRTSAFPLFGATPRAQLVGVLKSCHIRLNVLHGHMTLRIRHLLLRFLVT